MRNKDPRFINKESVAVITLTDTSAQTWTAPADSDGCYLEFINVVTSTDESSNSFEFQILDDTDTMVGHLGAYSVAANCGTVGTPPENIKTKMEYLDADGSGNYILTIPAGYKLQVTAGSSPGSDVYITIGYGRYNAD